MQTKNPYGQIIQMMRDQGAKYNPPSIYLAEVIAPPPDICMKLGDIQVNKENILIADYLLKEYKREYYADGKIVFNDTDCGKTTMDNHNYAGGHGVTSPHGHGVKTLNVDTEDYYIEGNSGKYLKFTCTLKKGDILAVMPTYDMQMYIIVARVVKPDHE